MTAKPRDPENTTESAESRQLQRDNEALQRQVDELRTELQQQRRSGAAAPGLNPPPRKPSFEISEGERNDLATQGVTRSAFTGEDLYADDHGIEVVTETGRERLRKAREQRHQDRPGETTQTIPGV